MYVCVMYLAISFGELQFVFLQLSFERVDAFQFLVEAAGVVLVDGTETLELFEEDGVLFHVLGRRNQLAAQTFDLLIFGRQIALNSAKSLNIRFRWKKKW